MKILFLIRSLDVGGAERQVLLLSQGLAEKGHQVGICVFYPGKLDHDLSSKVQLIHLHKKGRWDSAGFLKRLFATVKNFEPDVLHSYLIVPNIYSGLLKFFFPKIRVVWGLRSSNILEGHYTRMDKLTFYFSACLAWLPDLIIANSESGKQYHQKYYRNSHMLSIPNGIDPNKFSYQADEGLSFRRQWGVQDDEILIGNVGRLTPIKDHPLFLQSLTELKKSGLRFKAVCIGSGDLSYKEDLLKKSRDLGIHDQIIWIDHSNQMRSIYSAMDLSVLCSKSESFPNVVLESMACGAPCVVTEGAGDAALMVGSYGKVASHQSREISKACLELLEKKKAWTREELSQMTLDRYSQERLFERTEKILSS